MKFGFRNHDFEPDQIEILEDTLSESEAISKFQSFNWEEEYSGYLSKKERGLGAVKPTIYFFKSQANYLTITFNPEAFEITHWENGKYSELKSFFDISRINNASQPEDLIILFYRNQIESPEEIEFEAKREIKEKIKFSKIFKKYLLAPLGVFLLPIYFLLENGLSWTLVIFFLTVPLPFIHYFLKAFLALTYYQNSKKYNIEFLGNGFTLIKDGKVHKVNSKNISRLRIVKSNPENRFFKDFSYLQFNHNINSYVISNFIIEPEILLDVLRTSKY